MIVRRIRRLVLLSAALLLLAVVVAPLLNADRYRNAIRLALETALGRRVEIGRVRFTLYQGPTFSVQDVVIHDDPSFGLEPIAWVDSLEASPHLLSLWSRKFRFTSLRLVNPVVNLARTTRWNFEPFLNSGLVATAPRLSVRGGRISFRFGDLRSVFYIANTDLDVTASAGGEAWEIRFAGEPARTDRSAPGYGAQGFTSRGRWVVSPDGEDYLDLQIQVERSPIGEILAVLYGRDIGVRGVASSTLRVSGPLRELRISGQARVAEFRRWDQMPFKGDAWPVALRGRLNMLAQSLELESQSDGKHVLPLSLRYRVANYLTDPRWAVSATWSNFPAEHLVPIARHMGARLPESFRLTGSVDGAVGYSGGGSLQGRLLLRDASMAFGGQSALRTSTAHVVFDGDEVRLAPSAVRAGADTTATIEALYGWTTNRIEIGVAAERAPVRDLPFREAGVPAPLLDQLTSGTWSGKLRYQRDDAEAKGFWSGQAQLRGASVVVDGLAAPMRALSASVQLQGERLIIDRLQGRIGALEINGSYRYEPAAARPHRFRLAIPQADGAEIERLLLPALRRRENFFARTLGIGRSPEPDWLARRHADGAVQIGELTLGELSLSDFRTRLVWDASRVRWLDAQAKVLNGLAYGELEARLQRDGPVYHLNAMLDSVDFKNGKLNADLRIDSSGTGAELLAKLRSEGSFTGRGLELSGPETLRTVSGCYRVEWAASQPRLRFTELQMSMGGDNYLGYGSSQDDGRLLLQLTSGAKQLRMIGTLAQLRVE